LNFLSRQYRATYVFAVIFLAFTIYLCIRLGQWDDSADVPGLCYNSAFVNLPGASHPSVDRTYVSTTAVWLLVLVCAAVFSRPDQRRVLLTLAFLQFPLHLYMMIALRSANQGLLDGGKSENEWDFGQTATMVLLAATVHEAISKLMGYWRFEAGLKKKRNSSEDINQAKTSEGEEGIRMTEIQEC
jgi:hypothetical protein